MDPKIETPIEKIWRLLRELDAKLPLVIDVAARQYATEVNVIIKDFRREFAEIRDALRELEKHGADDAYADHVTCTVCGNCCTCNLRPCRDGGVHTPDMRPCRICHETADKHGPGLLCNNVEYCGGQQFTPETL